MAVTAVGVAEGLLSGFVSYAPGLACALVCWKLADRGIGLFDALGGEIKGGVHEIKGEAAHWKQNLSKFDAMMSRINRH